MFELIYILLFMCLLYYTFNKYDYLINVAIYAIGRGLIPGIISYNGFFGLVFIVLLRLVIGAIIVKLLTILNEYLQDGKWFIIVGILLEGFVSRFVVAFIVAFIIAI